MPARHEWHTRAHWGFSPFRFRHGGFCAWGPGVGFDFWRFPRRAQYLRMLESYRDELQRYKAELEEELRQVEEEIKEWKKET